MAVGPKFIGTNNEVTMHGRGFADPRAFCAVKGNLGFVGDFGFPGLENALPGRGHALSISAPGMAPR